MNNDLFKWPKYLGNVYTMMISDDKGIYVKTLLVMISNLS